MGADGGIPILRPAPQKGLTIEQEFLRIGLEVRLHNLSPEILREQRARRKKRKKAS